MRTWGVLVVTIVYSVHYRCEADSETKLEGIWKARHLSEGSRKGSQSSNEAMLFR